MTYNLSIKIHFLSQYTSDISEWTEEKKDVSKNQMFPRSFILSCMVQRGIVLIQWYIVIIVQYDHGIDVNV